MPKLWLFDLDDTLFEASGGMLHKIHLLMNEYMCRELGMEWEEASALRRHYWSVYGATFPGALEASWHRSPGLPELCARF